MQKLLVPVDLSGFSEKSVEYAAKLARLTRGTMTLLTIIEDVLPYYELLPIAYPPPDYFATLKETAETKLAKLIEKHAPDIKTEVQVRRGTPTNEIIETAKSGGHDLIVMASHGHSGLEHALLGSVTEKVLRKAPCPVLVVR